MGRPIDELDLAIIRLLQQDSRMPSAVIARQLGVAERTVRARINRLVQDDVIRLVAVLNPAALGYEVVADIFLEVEPTRLEEVAARVAEMQEVSYVGLTTGERDISVQVFTSSIDALYRLITERLSPIPGVLNTTTYIVPRVLKWLHNWSLPDDHLRQEAARPARRRRSVSDGSGESRHRDGKKRRSKRTMEVGAES